MLNKLLKRCMPWMDKGRWYHVRVEGEMSGASVNVTKVIYDKPMFSRHEIDATDYGVTVKIYFNDALINASIIDFKPIVHAYNPDHPSYFSKPDDILLDIGTNESGNFIELYPYPGEIDLWLFIKTN